MYESQKLQVYSSFRRSETQFRHQQGQLRAGAILGSIILFQRPFISVNGVEHEKKVNI